MRESVPDKSLSKQEEHRLVEAGKRVLLDGGYPNPDRVGCPGSEVLRALAVRKMDLRQAQEWVLHIGSCSPCFIEYNALREQSAKRRKFEFALATVGLLAVIGVGAWLWKINRVHRTGGKPNESKVPALTSYQEFTVDLRNRLVLRGEEPPSVSATPLELPRGRLNLSVYLPLGSREGDYELRVLKQPEKLVTSATAPARLQNHITLLKVKADLSAAPSGPYLLGIRRRGFEWSYYPLILK